jgi:hypothetical protein
VVPAANLFGIELEGLSPEDQEYQTARRFVQFAAEATRRAMAARRRLPPPAAARAGIVSAARRHAPGLLRPGRPKPGWQKPWRPRRPGRPVVVGPTIVEPPIVEPPVGYVPSRKCCRACGGGGQAGWYRQGQDLVVVNVFPPDDTADNGSA